MAGAGGINLNFEPKQQQNRVSHIFMSWFKWDYVTTHNLIKREFRILILLNNFGNIIYVCKRYDLKIY